MCKKTSGSQTAVTNAVFNTRRGTGTGGGGTPAPAPVVLPPDLESGLPGPIFGSPDFAPQHTFVAQPRDAADSFIAVAMAFHTNSGLAPRVATSIESIIDALDTPAMTQTGIINRLRIVSHVFHDDTGQSEPTAMMIRFLEGGARRTIKRYFEGFAAGRIPALKSMMKFEVVSFSNVTHHINALDASAIRATVASAHSAILAPITTDPLGEMSADFTEFFKICGSLWSLNIGTISDAALTNDLRAAYGILYDDLKPRLAPILSAANADILRDAIGALGNTGTISTQTPGRIADYKLNLSRALALLADNAFFDKLGRVRERFNQASKIDIRGCQVGRDPDFLRAFRVFFGKDATVRPSVSGPRFFQHFNAVGAVMPQANTNVVTLHGSGHGGHTAAEMATQLSAWADGFGVTDGHLTAWSAALNLDALSFCALSWKTTIPATTVPVAQLVAMRAANFANTIASVARIFLVTGSAVPSAAVLTAVAPLAADAATTSAQLTAPVADTATPAQLTTGFDQLKAIYERIDTRFTSAGGSPPAAGRPVPATQPTPFVAADLRALQSALTTFINTNANSRLRPIKQFMAAVHGRTTDAPARFRYYLGLGLPLLLHRAGTQAAANANFLIMFEDTAGTARRQDEAVAQWIRAQWRGIIPATLAAGTNVDSRETPWLVENRQPGGDLVTPPFIISPTDEYQSHIITLLASDN